MEMAKRLGLSLHEFSGLLRGNSPLTLGFPVTWLVAFALQGCVTAPDTPQQPEVPPATLDEPLSIQPQTFIMRGQVVVGPSASPPAGRPGNARKFHAITSK